MMIKEILFLLNFSLGVPEGFAQDLVRRSVNEIKLFQAKEIVSFDEAQSFIQKIPAHDAHLAELITAIPDVVLPPRLKQVMFFLKSLSDRSDSGFRMAYGLSTLYFKNLNDELIILESKRLNFFQKRKLIKKISQELLEYQKQMITFFPNNEGARQVFLKELFDHARADDLLVQETLLRALKSKLRLPRYQLFQQIMIPFAYYPMAGAILLFLSVPLTLNFMITHTAIPPGTLPFFGFLAFTGFVLDNKVVGKKQKQYALETLPALIQEAKVIREERNYLLRSIQEVSCNQLLLKSSYGQDEHE